MPQSLSNILIHIVFSTKNRARLIKPRIESELYPYIASVCNVFESPLHIVGGTSNHVHLLCSLGRTMPISKVVEEVKKRSSKWIKGKSLVFKNFAWQNGYGAFSIGQSQVSATKKYIAGQKEHHKRTSFQDEYRSVLDAYHVPCDERYVWD